MLTWPRQGNNQSDFDDYRESHKARGADYDNTIQGSPLDAFMDRWEAYYLLQIIPPLFGGIIPRYLDFACGTGRITQRVEPFASESYGIDISESMLQTARAKCPKTQFVCADLTRNDTHLGLFDLITSFRFMGNAQDELRESALSAISRHLRPGGYFILNNHRNPRSFLWTAKRLTQPGKEMYLPQRRLKSLLRDHGFEVLYQRAIGFWIYRFKLSAGGFLESDLAQQLQQFFSPSWYAPFSLDSVLVAQKL